MDSRDTKSSRDTPVGIITGAATGIGAAAAVEFARQLGARLVVVSLPGDDLTPVSDEVRAAGGAALAVAADVRDAPQCEQVASSAVETYGRIDFVHANAGVADQSGVANGDPGRWKRVIDTNLLGAAYTVRAVLPIMLRQGSGHILFTASTSGRETYVGEPLYIASKWGLVGFGHALRKEVLQHGIRVTLIEPGMVDTPLTREAPAINRLVERSVPLQPEDVARAVVWAFRQPAHVNVNEIALVPLVEADFGPGELEAITDAPRDVVQSRED